MPAVKLSIKKSVKKTAKKVVKKPVKKAVKKVTKKAKKGKARTMNEGKQTSIYIPNAIALMAFELKEYYARPFSGVVSMLVKQDYERLKRESLVKPVVGDIEVLTEVGND